MEDHELYAMQLATSSVMPMALKAAIELGVFDIINSSAGPASASQIASKLDMASSSHQKSPVGEIAERLDPILQLLSSHSILIASGTTSYSLAPVAKYFLKDDGKRNGSLGPFVSLVQDKVILDALVCLKEAVVEGGGNAFYKAYGMTGMEYSKKDARFREVFRRSNSELSPLVTETILDRYSAQGFEGVESLVDVGGGNGSTLHLILCRVPTISKAINFDLPSVIANSPSYPGVEHVAGDMFESVPKGDAIFIKWVMHMWEDQDCLKLLRNCFEATPENGKVVVVDTVIPETSETTGAAKALLQFNLYRTAVKPHGKERTLAQFHNLAQQAGFVCVRVACSAFNFSVLEFLKT